MYVYRTAIFVDKTTRWGLERNVKTLLLGLSRVNALPASWRQNHGYVNKREAGKYRFVGKLVRVQGETVLVLLDAFLRGDHEYGSYLRDPERYGENHLDPLIDQHHLTTAFTEWTKATSNAPPQFEPLPEHCLRWLAPAVWEFELDLTVYETPEWVERFRKPDFLEMWQSFQALTHKILELVIENQPLERSTPIHGVYVVGTESASVLFSVMTTSTPGADQLSTAVLLLMPKLGTFRDEEIVHVVEEYLPTGPAMSGSSKLPVVPLDDLARVARRCYPWYMVGSDPSSRSWLDLQKERGANLALSVEEQSLLRSVSLERGGLPIFINGRAGSGKSTMLYYLFADYCHRFLHNPCGESTEAAGQPERPIFISYNERLVERAREFVAKVLESHVRFAVRSGADPFARIDVERIRSLFQPFRRLLLELLPDEHEHFTQSSYISFFDFKRLYTAQHVRDRSDTPLRTQRDLVCRLPEAGQIPAELSWHAVRTFIKGWDHTTLLDPEQYAKLPTHQQTIPMDMFRRIYDSIWARWYSGFSREGYWDDQDLVRRALSVNVDLARYVAVFCDEAQDFTRVELRLLMRLCVLSKYECGTPLIERLPFAFAGDPFQTINPTGFRWDNTRALFYNEVISGLDPFGRSLVKNLNYRELQHNYRSLPHIVEFSNTIQLWRRVLFGHKDVQPQGAFARPIAREVEVFLLDKVDPTSSIVTREGLRGLTNTILLLPCEEFGEAEFVRNDPQLSKVFGDSPDNVLSAAAAKGSEFEKVVLYKFGEAFGKASLEPLELLLSGAVDPSMEIEYFFNKLYVAVTRATKDLYVIDSREGFASLWKVALNRKHLSGLVQKIGQPEWTDSVRPATLGVDPQLMAVTEPAIMRQQAETLRTAGLESQSAVLLRKARGFFQRLSAERDAAICQAHALEYDGDLLQAGRAFQALGELDNARRCYWKGFCWRDTLKLTESLSGLINQEMAAVARFLLAPSRDSTALVAFSDFLRRSLDSDRDPKHYEPQWAEAISALEDRTRQLATNLATTDCINTAELLCHLTDCGFPGLLSTAGECFYHAGHFKRAADCWEESQQRNRREYSIAKAHAAGFPTGLTYLEQVGEDDEILAIWERFGKRMDESWWRYASGALERKGKYSEAINGYLEKADTEQVVRCYRAAVVSGSGGKASITHSLLEGIVAHLTNVSRWDAIAELLAMHQPSRGKASDVDLKQYARLAFGLIRVMNERQYVERVQSTQNHFDDVFRILLFESRIEPTQFLHVEEVGSGLERIGILVTTLKFYERYAESKDERLRGFVRGRWLIVKTRQTVRQIQERGASRNPLPIPEAGAVRAERTDRENVERLIEMANNEDSQLRDRRGIDQWNLQLPSPEELDGFPDLRSILPFQVGLLPLGGEIRPLSDGDVEIVVGKIHIKLFYTRFEISIRDDESDHALRLDLRTRRTRMSEDFPESRNEFAKELSVMMTPCRLLIRYSWQADPATLSFVCESWSRNFEIAVRLLQSTARRTHAST